MVDVIAIEKQPMIKKSTLNQFVTVIDKNVMAPFIPNNLRMKQI